MGLYLQWGGVLPAEGWGVDEWGGVLRDGVVPTWGGVFGVEQGFTCSGVEMV